jgi:hypothetical protein
MTADLINQNVMPAPPSQVIQAAQEAAAQLKAVVSRKPKPVIINDEQYLEFEDWQTVGHFYGMHVRTGEAERVEIDGIKGAKARAQAISESGIVIGGAEAYCLSDEPNWQGKPWFQIASMAQTRAGSKALSNCLRWVVVLAGYRGTPAEEMTGREKPLTDEIDTSSPLYCAEHKTLWFKRGKMTSYAHPVEGSDKWCRQPAVKSVPAADPSASPEPNLHKNKDEETRLKTWRALYELAQASAEAKRFILKALTDKGFKFGNNLPVGPPPQIDQVWIDGCIGMVAQIAPCLTG